MLKYIEDQLRQAMNKLEAVRLQCLTLDDSEQSVRTEAQFIGRAWQLKPHEIEVGLWQGRLLEAQSVDAPVIAPDMPVYDFDPAIDVEIVS